MQAMIPMRCVFFHCYQRFLHDIISKSGHVCEKLNPGNVDR